MRIARWRRFTRPAAAVFLVAGVIALGSGEPVRAAPARQISGWVPYWDSAEGRASFADPTMAAAFEDISPFFSSANSAGQIATLNPSAMRATIDAARAKALFVLPSITDGTGPGEMAALLADPARRAAHVQGIVDWVAAYGTDGADLDYEGFAFADGRDSWASTRPLWVQFVAELSGALHARGKLLSVTVPPEWGTSSGYWVYAMGQIYPYVDRLRLMVYDWSVGSPGPIAPISWVDDVIAKTHSLIDPTGLGRSRLQLGIPAYGRNWATKTNSSELCPSGALATRSVEQENADALAAAHGVAPTRHSSGELTFTWTETVTGILSTPVTPPPYTPPPTYDGPLAGGFSASAGAQRLGTAGQMVTCTIRHTVYVPDAESAAVRALRAESNGWRGVIVWALGYEDQSFRDALYLVADS
jgi:spore germination protein